MGYFYSRKSLIVAAASFCFIVQVYSTNLVLPRPSERGPRLLQSPYKPCNADTSNGVMENVEVVPCDGTDRCPLVKGTNVTLLFDFVPKIAPQNVTGSVAGVLGFFTVPFTSE